MKGISEEENGSLGYLHGAESTSEGFFIIDEETIRKVRELSLDDKSGHPGGSAERFRHTVRAVR